MLVSKKKYKKLEEQLEEALRVAKRAIEIAEREHQTAEMYKGLVRKPRKARHTHSKEIVHVQFDQRELKMLLMFCHPDRHNDCPTATEITRKILSLRK